MENKKESYVEMKPDSCAESTDVETVDAEAAEADSEMDKAEDELLEKAEEQNKDKTTLLHRILTIVGIALCVFLIPILIVNCTLIIKSMLNKKEVPTFGTLLPLIILTDSMENEFPGGSLIICSVSEPHEVEKQDIIAFYDPESQRNMIVTHQVIDIIYDEDGNVESFITKGTSNNTEDRLPVPAENLIATYTGIRFKGLGSLALFMQTPKGFIVCVIFPLLILVAYDIVRRKIYDQKRQKEQDQLIRELTELRLMREQALAAAEGAKNVAPAEEGQAVPAEDVDETQKIQQ